MTALRQLGSLVAGGLLGGFALAAGVLWGVPVIVVCSVHSAHWYDRRGIR